MRCGFTADEALSMWDSLSREVFKYYDYKEKPPQGIVMEMPWILGTSLAVTSFANNGKFGFEADYVIETSTSVGINEKVLPYMFEDELIGVLLHEAAHVVAGL